MNTSHVAVFEVVERAAANLNLAAAAMHIAAALESLNRTLSADLQERASRALDGTGELRVEFTVKRDKPSRLRVVVQGRLGQRHLLHDFELPVGKG